MIIDKLCVKQLEPAYNSVKAHKTLHSRTICAAVACGRDLSTVKEGSRNHGVLSHVKTANIVSDRLLMFRLRKTLAHRQTQIPKHARTHCVWFALRIQNSRLYTNVFSGISIDHLGMCFTCISVITNFMHEYIGNPYYVFVCYVRMRQPKISHAR